MQPSTDRSAIRPDETAADRLRWILGVEPSPDARSVHVEACDYRGLSQGHVIEDCLRAAGIVDSGMWVPDE